MAPVKPLAYPPTTAPVSANWVLACGGLILFLSIGTRQGFGFFLLPVTTELGVGREQFAIAVATQYLAWGACGPIAGVLADTYGTARTLVAEALLYSTGLVAASIAQTAFGFGVSAGLLMGAGLGGASYGVVQSAVARVHAEHRRGTALGIVSAVGAFGQFALLFFTHQCIATLGWRSAMAAHAALVVLIVPLALALQSPLRLKDQIGSTAPANKTHPSYHKLLNTPDYRTVARGMVAAARTRSFWLLCTGFAFSGFQVMFTMTHLPAMLDDLKFERDVAIQALAAISFTSFLGSWLFSSLADHFKLQQLLAFVYALRAVFALAALLMPWTHVGLIAYFALLGFVWMSTIPLASAMAASLFGTRFMASIFSLVFLAHQIGGFFRTWLGGKVYDKTGSYQTTWIMISVMCAAGAVMALAIYQPNHPKNGLASVSLL